MKKRLSEFVTSRFSWKKVVDIARGLSSAELTRASEEAIKHILINRIDKITLEDLIEAISDRSEMRKNLTK